MKRNSSGKIENTLAGGFGIYLVWLLTLFLPATVNAQNINCAFQRIDDRGIRILKPADVAEKRREITRAIWGSDHMTGRSDVVITRDIQSPLHPFGMLARVDKIDIPSHIPVKPGAAAIKDLAYLLVPVKRNGRLIIVHHGHACTFKDARAGDKGYRMEVAIDTLLGAGFDVLAVFMPQITETACNMNHCPMINTDLGLPNPRSTFGLRLFLEPTIVSLNYILKHTTYKSVDMMGLSGGGWTTTLVAAIDERIKLSFPVAGSVPLYYRSGKDTGDIEQYLPAFYQDVAGHPDLYVLGAYGPGRKQIQILNLHDDCCFGQPEHTPGRDYVEDVHTFEQTVKNRLKALGEDRHYELVIDSTSLEHQVSKYALNQVILPELRSVNGY